jgi:hypothetical protein
LRVEIKKKSLGPNSIWNSQEEAILFKCKDAFWSNQHVLVQKRLF